MTAESDRLDLLEGLLDVQKVTGELFDAVESGRLDVDRALCIRVGRSIAFLTEFHRGMVVHYATSGRAGGELLAAIREGLRG